MSDHPTPNPERSSLEMDLAMSFLPSWAKGDAASDNASKLASRFGGGEDRKGGRGKGDRQESGPRRPARMDRPRRTDKPREEGRRDPVRPVRQAPEVLPLEGWDVRFLPDRNGVEGLAKQIRASARAYPLFDLVRLVLEKSERYVVEFKRKDASAPSLFQVRADGTLWLNESDAISRALSANFDQFYRRESITVEPPKGNFPCVAQCGMSDVLLGPPNYHDYPVKVRRLHAERFSHIPFDTYQSRIRMVKEEALIEKWRADQATQDVFFPVGEAQAPPDNVAATPAGNQPATEELPPEEAVSADAAPEDSAITASLTDDPAAEAVAADAVTRSGDADAATALDSEDAGLDASTPEESGAGGASDLAAPAGARPEPLATYADAERHFRQHNASKAILAIRDRVVSPGPAALNDSAPEVLELTRGLWEELNRFPLPVAHGLGRQLTGKGLQIFKDRDNVTVVSVARPRALDYEANPVSDALRAMLQYLEQNAGRPRAEQWAGLVALRPIKEGESEAQREMAVASDLSWLLREGHVVDFVKRGLEVVRRQPAKSAPPAGGPQ